MGEARGFTPGIMPVAIRLLLSCVGLFRYQEVSLVIARYPKVPGIALDNPDIVASASHALDVIARVVRTPDRGPKFATRGFFCKRGTYGE